MVFCSMIAQAQQIKTYTPDRIIYSLDTTMSVDSLSLYIDMDKDHRQTVFITGPGAKKILEVVKKAKCEDIEVTCLDDFIIKIIRKPFLIRKKIIAGFTIFKATPPGNDYRTY